MGGFSYDRSKDPRIEWEGSVIHLDDLKARIDKMIDMPAFKLNLVETEVPRFRGYTRSAEVQFKVIGNMRFMGYGGNVKRLKDHAATRIAAVIDSLYPERKPVVQGQVTRLAA